MLACGDGVGDGDDRFFHVRTRIPLRCSVANDEQIEVIEVQKYLVKWCGLSYQFCTWEDREEVNRMKKRGKIRKFKIFVCFCSNRIYPRSFTLSVIFVEKNLHKNT